MKKLLSLVLVAVMVLSAVSVFFIASAEGGEGAEAAANYGDLVFVEEFNEDKTATYKANALGRTEYFTGNVAEGNPAYFKTEDGKLKVNVKYQSTASAIRFPLYKVSDDALDFTVQMIYKTEEKYDGSNALALIVADNCKDNWDGSGPKDPLPGTFQLFWNRVGTLTGVQSYGADKTCTRFDAETSTDYVLNQYYMLTISVDLATSKGVSTLAKYDAATQTAGTLVREREFNYETGAAGAGVEPVVGLLLTGVKAEIESVKVWETTLGELAFEEEFTDAAVATDLLANALGNYETIGAATEVNGAGYFKVEDGKLKFNICNSSTVNSVRIPLFEIPEGAKEFTTEMVFKSEAWNVNGSGNAIGLIIADNLIDNWDHTANASTSPTNGTWQFWWNRLGAGSGFQSYGAGKDAVRKDSLTGYTANEYHHLTITVDLENNTVVGTLSKYDTATGTVGTEVGTIEHTYEVGKAGAGVKPVVGLQLNGVKGEVESIRVWEKSTKGNVAFEENFDDATKADGYLAAALGQAKPAAVGDAFKIVDGKLVAEVGYVGHGRNGLRLPLYAIPDGVKSFSIEAKVMVESAVGTHSSDQYAGIGVIYADNLKEMGDGTAAAGSFYMHSLEVLYVDRHLGWSDTNGGYYGASSAGTTAKAPMGEWITVTVDVSMETNELSVTAAKADGTIIDKYTDTAKDIDKNVGIWISDGKAMVDYVKVYTNYGVQAPLTPAPETTAAETTTAAPGATTAPAATSAPATTTAGPATTTAAPAVTTAGPATTTAGAAVTTAGPAATTQAATSAASNTPTTGDSVNVQMLVAIMMFSCSAVLLVVVRAKKEH